MVNYGNIFDNEALTYSNYREVIYLLMQEGKATGTDHSPAMLHYTKMNNQRMNRIEATSYLTEELSGVVQNIKGKYHFLVISEGWCGDAAQIVPIFKKIEEAAPDRIKLKFVFRDEHLELMDQHLTNGGRAIPVLLVLDEANNLVLPKWGPRPAVLQKLLTDWKKEETDYAILSEKIHGWYAKDKTLTTQHELVAFLSKLV